MEQRADGGPDDIENAIPVCFDCHAEIHSYNDRHPRGRKFRPEELRAHKEQWLRICSENPSALFHAPREVYVGPLQGMVDELYYNRFVAQSAVNAFRGNGNLYFRAAAPLKNDQFLRAIGEGSIAILEDDLKDSLVAAYSHLGRMKLIAETNVHETARDLGVGALLNQLREGVKELHPLLEDAYKRLSLFLGTD